MSNLTLRILTAVVGIPLIAGATYAGGWWFTGVVLVGALAAQWEVYGLLRHEGARPFVWSGLVLGALLVVRSVWPPALALATFGAVLLVAVGPFVKQAEQPLRNLSATFFGVVYPAGLLAFLIDLRIGRGPTVGDLDAIWLTLTALVLIWATDSFAYFVGRAVGKRPLAPFISPKKTWEGAVGGAVSAIGVAAVLKLTLVPMLSWVDALALALICGVFSQFGDLAESHLKRSVGVKDSGRLLPGHGGLLDRLDALILAVPCVYLYLHYLARLID